MQSKSHTSLFLSNENMFYSNININNTQQHQSISVVIFQTYYQTMGLPIQNKSKAYFQVLK